MPIGLAFTRVWSVVLLQACARNRGVHARGGARAWGLFVDHLGYCRARRSKIVHCARCAARRISLLPMLQQVVATRSVFGAGLSSCSGLFFFCGRGLPQVPCIAQVCSSVSVCGVTGRAATSVVSVHLGIRPGVNPVGAAPCEAVGSCSPENAQTGIVKVCRPIPGTGIPRHGWACR